MFLRFQSSLVSIHGACQRLNFNGLVQHLETCILRPQDVFLLITNDHVFRVFLPHNRKNGCLQLKIMLELKMRTILSVLRCIDFSWTNSRELQFVLRYGAESFGIRSRLFYLGSPQRCFVVHETPMIVCMFHSNKRTTTAWSEDDKIQWHWVFSDSLWFESSLPLSFDFLRHRRISSMVTTPMNRQRYGFNCGSTLYMMGLGRRNPVKFA